MIPARIGIDTSSRLRRTPGIITLGFHVIPLSGQSAIEGPFASSGPGLFDRLIADGCSRAFLETMTLDRRGYPAQDKPSLREDLHGVQRVDAHDRCGIFVR